jgi:hypothetical protein
LDISFRRFDLDCLGSESVKQAVTPEKLGIGANNLRYLVGVNDRLFHALFFPAGE